MAVVPSEYCLGLCIPNFPSNYQMRSVDEKLIFASYEMFNGILDIRSLIDSCDTSYEAVKVVKGKRVIASKEEACAN
ncbi:hypothetical protein ACE6H2_009716 [Prunus campanulata]